MRILGIDYGEKRVGLALSDESGVFAFPYCVFQEKSKPFLFEKLKTIIAKEKVQKIVIGQPLNLKGAKTNQTKIIENFAQEIEKIIGLKIVFENEIFTTKIAKQHSFKNTDAASAALILQGYLDKNKFN